MFLHWKELREEIDYYEKQNNRLAVDDLLKEIFRKKPKHKKTIKENEGRIENLYWNGVGLHFQ